MSQYKGLSLTGSIRSGWDGHGHVNALRFRKGMTRSNIDAVNATGTHFVKLWVDWSEVQPNQVYSATESVNQINASEKIRWLDAEIREANLAGKYVILTVAQYYPTWANAGHAPDPAGRPARQAWPRDVSTNSPYGWFVGTLLWRYRAGGANNPSGASIWGLEACNEPNLLMWPQSGSGATTAQVASVMMLTAEYWSWYHNGPAILGPATSDVPENDETSGGVILRRGAYNFTYDVSYILTANGWILGRGPRKYVGWSHHNYRDCKYGKSGTYNGIYYDKWRSRHCNDYLVGRSWYDSGNFFLTEGGYEMTQIGIVVVGGTQTGCNYPVGEEGTQAEAIRSNFDAMKTEHPEVILWTQHQINDVWNLPVNTPDRCTRTHQDLYGLRRPADTTTSPHTPGADKLAYSTWGSRVGY